jgi:hypothetical protein
VRTLLGGEGWSAGIRGARTGGFRGVAPLGGVQRSLTHRRSAMFSQSRTGQLEEKGISFHSQDRCSHLERWWKSGR